MKADKQSRLVPKLRFPEFRNMQGWSKRSLGHFLTPIMRERKKPAIPYTGLGIRSHGKGTFRKELEQPEKTSMERLYEVNNNDLIVNITFAWEGAIAIVRPEDSGALVSHRFPTYQFDLNSVLPDFFRYPILDKQFIYNLGVISPGGAGRNRVLNKADFLKIEFALPEVAEQQKIADCLGSLDDLIAAEGEKLEALRRHKQGLMQQLFPQPGETVPRLRFPEFRDAEEWVEEKLGNIVTIMSGKSPAQYELFSQGDYAFVKVEDLNNCTKYQVYAREYCNDIRDAVPSGSILFPKRGAAIENNKIRITAAKMLIDTNLMALTPHNTASTEFLYYYIARVGLAQIADTSSIPQINNKHIIPYRVLIPSDKLEQQLIASSLSSLDDRIAAQDRRIKALKTHKQGLLQQLFPSPEGNE